MTITVTFRNDETTTVNVAGTGSAKSLAKWLDEVRITGVYVTTATTVTWYPFIEIEKAVGSIG